MTSDINKPPSKGTWTQPLGPNSDNPPKYPYNNITQTHSGHSFELDDTKGGERIRLQHRIGTYQEMTANGDMVMKIVGNGFEIVAGNKNVEITGFCNIIVHGNCNMKVVGDYTQQVDGDYNLVVAGDFNLRGHGEVNISSDDDVSIAANENFGGSLRLAAADNLQLDGDLDVSGSISCDSLVAESRVDAGMGVSAGPRGFTSGTGGLSLGYPTPATPLATPGCITAVGSVLAFLPITSLISLNAPLANIPVLANVGVMRATLMTDSLNTKLYDMHTHIGNKGFPTSPPLMPMI